MSEYHIEMVRADGISDAERWRRVCRAYDLILNFSLDDKTAPGDEFGDMAPEAASTPRPLDGDAQESIQQ